MKCSGMAQILFSRQRSTKHKKSRSSSRSFMTRTSTILTKSRRLLILLRNRMISPVEKFKHKRRFTLRIFVFMTLRCASLSIRLRSCSENSQWIRHWSSWLSCCQTLKMLGWNLGASQSSSSNSWWQSSLPSWKDTICSSVTLISKFWNWSRAWDSLATFQNHWAVSATPSKVSSIIHFTPTTSSRVWLLVELSLWSRAFLPSLDQFNQS